MLPRTGRSFQVEIRKCPLASTNLDIYPKTKAKKNSTFLAWVIIGWVICRKLFDFYIQGIYPTTSILT